MDPNPMTPVGGLELVIFGLFLLGLIFLNEVVSIVGRTIGWILEKTLRL